MSFLKLIARLSYSSLTFLKKAYNFFDAVLSGFWLGVMSEKSLDLYDELHYNRSQKYTDDAYNLSGLSAWEKERIEKYFSNTKNILLIAAGGGRETAALRTMGFNVDSYECNKKLVDYGNTFLQKNGFNATISYLPVNSVPEAKKYDGIIIGWGAYSHIRGKNKRVSFLTELGQLLNDDGPLMVSFVTREENGNQDKIVKKLSGFFRIISGREKTESGDRLMSYFIHFFTGSEIKSELSQAKFKIMDYYNIDYGCIIAIKQSFPVLFSLNV